MHQPGNFSPRTNTAHYQILEISGSGGGQNEPPAAMMMEDLRKSRRLFRFLRFEMAAYTEEIGISGRYLPQLLSDLAAGGWLLRLRRGLYAGTGGLPGDIRIHPFAISTRLVSPYAISHWSTLHHHGLIDQVPYTVTASTPRKVVTRSTRRTAGVKPVNAQGKHAWEVDDVRYEYVTVTEDRFFGIAEVWVDSQFKTPIYDAERRWLIHGYKEDLEVDLQCYALAEIVAEKMRALLQTQQKLILRGWTRPRARDYYDLWRILKDFGAALSEEGLSDLLRKKAAHRNVAYASVDDFFTAELMAEARRNWEGTLRPFVRNLPPCDDVLADLKQVMPHFFPDLLQEK